MKKLLFTELLSILIALCVGAGCAAQHAGNTVTYVAHAIIIEGPVAEFENIGWNDVTNHMKAASTTTVPVAVFQSPKIKIVHFPVLGLKPGQTTEASNQHLIRYATNLDTNGIPCDFKEQGPGQKIRILLANANTSHINVDAVLEDVQEPIWHKFTELKDGIPEFKVPFFASKSLTTKIELTVDSWCLIGGRTDSTNMTVFAIKVNHNR